MVYTVCLFFLGMGVKLSVMSYYDVLGVSVDCNFKELKRAYFKKAKECHPDRHSNSPLKTEEFKNLVEAFDVLSDSVKRAQYDQLHSINLDKQERIKPSTISTMDTVADDILEELIVGNIVPEETTLATLFKDLEKTEIFICFREGKYYYYKAKYRIAISYFRKCVNQAPHNILYRFFLARTCVAVNRFREAKNHYKTAINLGKHRVPCQKLERVRNELSILQKRRNPWWYNFLHIFSEDDDNKKIFYTPYEDAVDEANRAIANILTEQEKNRQIKEKNKKLLSK